MDSTASNKTNRRTIKLLSISKNADSIWHTEAKQAMHKYTHPEQQSQAVHFIHVALNSATEVCQRSSLCDTSLHPQYYFLLGKFCAHFQCEDFPKLNSPMNYGKFSATQHLR